MYTTPKPAGCGSGARTSSSGTNTAAAENGHDQECMDPALPIPRTAGALSSTAGAPSAKSAGSSTKGMQQGTAVDNDDPVMMKQIHNRDRVSAVIVDRMSSFIVRNAVNRPCCLCCTSMGIALLFASIMLAGLATGIFPFELDTSPDSFSLEDDSIADRGTALLAMYHETTSTPRVATKTAIKKGKSDLVYKELGGMYVLFEAKNGQPHLPEGADGNVFSQQAILQIKEFEQELRALPSFSKWCHRDKDIIASGNALAACLEFQQSPTKVVFGWKDTTLSAANQECCPCGGSGSSACFSASPFCTAEKDVLTVFFPDGDKDVMVPKVMQKLHDVDSSLGWMPQWAVALACEKTNLASSMRWFFDGGFTTAHPRSTTTRAYYKLGGVVDFRSLGANADDQARENFEEKRWRAMYTESSAFVRDEVRLLVQRYNEDKNSEIRIAIFHEVMANWEVMSAILVSGLFMFAGFLMVFLFISFHTGSVFLASAGISHILVSFPVTWLIYTVIFRLQYMGILNFISLFIVLGIGADDIFVLFDAWKQSRHHCSEEVRSSMQGRMKFAYTRASSAMFITSITDSAAFFSLLISKIPVIRIFGAFMGTIILVNYIMVITWLPAVIIFWSKQGWEDKTFFKPGGWCGSKIHHHDNIEQCDQSAVPKLARVDTLGRIEHDKSHVEKFFRDVWAPTLLGSWSRRTVVVLVFICAVACFAVLSSQLVPSDTEFRYESFYNDTNLMRFLNSDLRFNNTGQDSTEVKFVWGLGDDSTKAIDRKGTDRNNPKDIGKPRFVPGWNPATPASQQHILNACDLFRTRTGLPLKRNEGGDGEVACFMYHFRDWVRALRGPDSFPVPSLEFAPLLANFTSQPDNSTCTAYPTTQCQAYFSTVLPYKSAFRERSSSGQPMPHLAWRGQVLWGCEKACDEQGEGEIIRGLVIAMNSSISQRVGGYHVRPFFDALEGVAHEINAEAPAEAMRGFQVDSSGGDGSSKWMRMRVEEDMFSSTFQGCSVQCAFAFVVLTISTSNVFISMLAILNIGAILVSCVGYIVLLGWKFGSVEAICITISVGFSVDFVQHIAISFNESPAELKPYERVRLALSEIGVSVSSACASTFGAAAFMLPAPMIPFMKIGAFVMWDILISLLVAVGPFAAMLCLPQSGLIGKRFGDSERRGAWR